MPQYCATHGYEHHEESHQYAICFGRTPTVAGGASAIAAGRYGKHGSTVLVETVDIGGTEWDPEEVKKLDEWVQARRQAVGQYDEDNEAWVAHADRDFQDTMDELSDDLGFGGYPEDRAVQLGQSRLVAAGVTGTDTEAADNASDLTGGAIDYDLVTPDRARWTGDTVAFGSLPTASRDAYQRGQAAVLAAYRMESPEASERMIAERGLTRPADGDTADAYEAGVRAIVAQNRLRKGELTTAQTVLARTSGGGTVRLGRVTEIGNGAFSGQIIHPDGADGGRFVFTPEAVFSVDSKHYVR